MSIPLLLKRAGALCVAFLLLSLALPQAALAGDWFTEIREDYQDRFGDSDDPYADGTGEAVVQPEADLPAPPDSGTSIPDDWFDEIKDEHEGTQGEEPAEAMPDGLVPQLWDEGVVILPEKQETAADYTDESVQEEVPMAQGQEILDQEDAPLEQEPLRQVSDGSLTDGVDVEIEGLEYILDSQGNAIITAYTGKAMELIIPSKLGGHPVTEVRSTAFRDNQCPHALVLPESILSIEPWTFSQCYHLRQIVLPPEITEIPESAFDQCTDLEAIVIPGKVTHIGRNAFFYCKSLMDITFPASVREIEWSSFDLCDRVFTSHVVSGSYAEQYAKNEFAPRPYKIIRTGETQASGDFEFIVPQEGYALLTKYRGTAEELAVPPILRGYSVEAVDDKAFHGCASLSRVTLPETVRWMGDSVFENCGRLTEVILPPGLNDIGARTFASCPVLERVQLPGELTRISSGMFQSCDSLQVITLPDKVKSIESWAFSGCHKLREVTIPPGVGDISQNAFPLSPLITFMVQQGSFVHEYALSYEIRHVIIP